MFYEPAKANHGLPHNPFKACVVPRPIGWITSLDEDGRVNLAPYSFFNAIADDPPQVMFASNGVKAPTGERKDSISNVEATGEFVANLASWDLRKEMVLTSAPLAHGEAESGLAGLELEPARLVKPPRVKAAAIHLECRVWRTIELPCATPGQRNGMVIGEVIGIQIADEILVDGMIDLTLVKPVARLGYLEYAVVESAFEMVRPTGGG